MNDVESPGVENGHQLDRCVATARAERDLSKTFFHLHPTHTAKAYREIEKHAGEKAHDQEMLNEEHGVPE